jgi:hypothetical protein
MTSAAMTGSQAKKMKCSGCACDLGGSSGFHFHHDVPATPGGHEYDPWIQTMPANILYCINNLPPATEGNRS